MRCSAAVNVGDFLRPMGPPNPYIAVYRARARLSTRYLVAEQILDDFSALDHQRDAFRVVEEIRVSDRITAERDEIGQFPRLDRSQAVILAHDRRVAERRAPDRLERTEYARFQRDL